LKNDGVKVNGKDDIPAIWNGQNMEWDDDSHILTIYESQLRNDYPIYDLKWNIKNL
jgi:hypothetical protein